MILVTGGRRGLGRAIAEYQKAKGRKVALLSRTGDGDDPLHFKADVRDPDALRRVAKELRASGHKLDALVNAAGIASMNLTLTMPGVTARNIIDVNLLGTIQSCQAFAPLMVRHKKGSIINFSTIAVELAIAGEAVYAASKAGVETFSRVFAREMAAYNVRVNTVAPGPVLTDLIKGVDQSNIDTILRRQLDPTPAEPSDIADVVDLLLDPRAASITGETLHIRGV